MYIWNLMSVEHLEMSCSALNLERGEKAFVSLLKNLNSCPDLPVIRKLRALRHTLVSETEPKQ